MFLITIFTLSTVACLEASESRAENKNAKHFNNLKPIVKVIDKPNQKKIIYQKVPTKMIKIDKNSN